MNDDTHVRERPSEGRAEGAPRVVIVDDHPDYAEGLAQLLRELGDLDIVSIVHDADRGVEAAATHRPDLVLMDIRLPDRSAIEATRRIQGAFPDMKVIVLTASTQPEDVHDALKAGARGYLLKHSDAGKLLASIDAVCAGETVIEATLLKTLDAYTRPDPLTEADIYLLKLLAKGLELSTIARRLGISESTVKRQIVQVQRKLGVANRIQAVVAAATRGLLQRESGN